MDVDDEKEPQNTNILPSKPPTNNTNTNPSIFPTVSGKITKLDIPWLEKYRPKLLQNVVGNEQTILRLSIIAQHGNMPNLIISGPPGTGKTTSIHCLALELLGPKLYKKAVLELNASDERGIDVVRNKIKMFAQLRVTLPVGRHKIIILDEADNMTIAAQQALRRTMEIYSKSTRFALACNVSSKIIEPLQSRCAILRYSRLEDKQILKRIMQILNYEKIESYTRKGLEAILFVADGDMRNAINSLQATHAGFSFISDTNVYKVCDIPPPHAIREILKACVMKDVRKACLRLQALLKQGFASLDFVSVLFRVTKSYKMDEGLKLEWIRDIGFMHARIADGLDSPLQLSGLLAKLCLAGYGKSTF